MRLHNLLTLPGGEPEQGLEITFRLRYPGPGNVPHYRTVVGVLYPLSPVDALACERKATELAATKDASLNVADEYVIQVVSMSLRDPGDLSKRLIEDPRDQGLLRAGLVAPQFGWLMERYKSLIETEYPGLVTTDDERALSDEAGDFSASDQPARG